MLGYSVTINAIFLFLSLSFSFTIRKLLQETSSIIKPHPLPSSRSVGFCLHVNQRFPAHAFYRPGSEPEFRNPPLLSFRRSVQWKHARIRLNFMHRCMHFCYPPSLDASEINARCFFPLTEIEIFPSWGCIFTSIFSFFISSFFEIRTRVCSRHVWCNFFFFSILESLLLSKFWSIN